MDAMQIMSVVCENEAVWVPSVCMAYLTWKYPNKLYISPLIAMNGSI